MTYDKPDAHGLWAYGPGQVLLEKYELIRPIAEGGSGVVWVAKNRILDLDVALKLTRRLKEDTGGTLTERALTEARVCAQLTHPAVCRVLDFALTEHGDPCVVSELLEGQTLDDLLASEERVPALRAVQIILPILDGLAAAHAKGIVHRDVKPANIFLARDADGREQPKLLDFGIARWMNDTRRLTVPGTVCGTPYYMSPEQARGSVDLDHRSDIWSVCATLYELLAGVPPFDGENYPAMITAILGAEELPLTELGVGDESLSEIVARGLRKSPAERYASATELAKELAAWLIEQGVSADLMGRPLAPRLTEAGLPPQISAPRGPSPSAAELLSRARTPVSGTTVRKARPERTDSIPEGVVRAKHPETSRIVSVALGLLILGSVSWLAMRGLRGTDSATAQADVPSAAALNASEAVDLGKIEALLGSNKVPYVDQSVKTSGALSSDAEQRRASNRKAHAEPTPQTSSVEKATPAKRDAKATNHAVQPQKRKTNAMGYEFGF